MPDSFDGFCCLWPEANPEGSVEEYASSHQPFSKMFLMHTIFPFRTSSIAINKPYSLRPYIIKNVRTKCIIFGEALRIKVKRFKHNLPENYSKNTKKTVTACKFLKISRGSMPPDPLKVF